MDWAIAGTLEIVSIACAIHLWARAKGGAARMVAWTPLVLVPVVDPLFYGGFYSVPPAQNEALRAADDTDTDTDTDFGE